MCQTKLSRVIIVLCCLSWRSCLEGRTYVVAQVVGDADSAPSSKSMRAPYLTADCMISSPRCRDILLARVNNALHMRGGLGAAQDADTGVSAGAMDRLFAEAKTIKASIEVCAPACMCNIGAHAHVDYLYGASSLSSSVRRSHVAEAIAWLQPASHRRLHVLIERFLLAGVRGQRRRRCRRVRAGQLFADSAGGPCSD